MVVQTGKKKLNFIAVFTRMFTRFSYPKAVNLGSFSLLLRGGLRNQRFEASLLPTHPPTHPTHVITENLIFISKPKQT